MTTAHHLFRAPGDLERVEARLCGPAFAPHRHDTYVIGVTLKGIQSFDYRGVARHSRPGQFVILYPDELHDGRAGDGGIFHYRTAYIPPAHIQTVLGGGRPLPFIDSGVSSDDRLRAPIHALLHDFGHPLTPQAQDDALYDLATALNEVAGGPSNIETVNRTAAAIAREYIDARLCEHLSLHELERATGCDRWELSRGFRVVYGTSPYRYATLRRLDRAKSLLLAGGTLADTATRCGFTDQSHFGRHFKAAFGLTPNIWRKAMRTHNRSISNGFA